MEEIRVKRGDPLVEFDRHGNKIQLNAGSSSAPKTREISEKARDYSENLTNEEVDEHREFSKKD